MASWDLEKRHGLFTEHLLAALYGAADTPRYGAADGNVTLGEVRKYLSRNMSYAAKRTYGRIQHATINGGEDVVLAALGANHPKRPVLDIGSTQAVALTPVKTPRPKPNDLHLTKEIINSWWDGPKNYQTEKVFCEKLIKVVEVHPSSGESAFIAVCAVNRSHIEGFDAFLIIRPKFKEAKEFSSLRGSGSIHQVVDLDNDGISEIVLSSGETHQGFHHAEIQIIGINGWNADVIYQRNIEDCTGNSSYRYVKDCAFGEPTEISFIFEDLDGDQVLDLVETVNYFVKFKDMSIDEAVKRFGQNWWEVGIALEEATRVNHYLFKNRVFIPYRLN